MTQTPFDRDARGESFRDVLAWAETVMSRFIHPKPDSDHDHPWSVLLRVRAALAAPTQDTPRAGMGDVEAPVQFTRQIVDELLAEWREFKKGSLPQEYEYGYEAALQHVVYRAGKSVPSDQPPAAGRLEWPDPQPMETAPKDGTDILLQYDGRAPVVAAWFRSGWAPMDLGGNHLTCGVPSAWWPLPSEHMPPVPTLALEPAPATGEADRSALPRAPGTGWQLSDETKRHLREIDENIALARHSSASAFVVGASATAPATGEAVEALHIVFDGPPGPEAGRFVEVETPDGKSVSVRNWHERPDGLWELRIPRAALAAIQPATPATGVAEAVAALLREFVTEFGDTLDGLDRNGPDLTCADGIFVWASAIEDRRDLIDRARTALATLAGTAAGAGWPDSSVLQMVTADNARMRAAGLKLSEAALRVIREYDGTHRLSLAVAEWAKAIADEGLRAEAYGQLPCPDPARYDRGECCGGKCSPPPADTHEGA